MTDYPPAAVPRARRRHGVGVTTLGIILVLAAIAVVGDRVAAKYATDQLRSELIAGMNANDVNYGTTTVAIGGFPFVTQVAKGRYDAITIAITDIQLVAVSGRVVTLPRLDVVATGVEAKASDVVKRSGRAMAQQVTGRAVISFATLEKLVDYTRYSLQDVRFAESDGGVQVTANATVAGTKVPISGTANVSVVDGALSVKLRDARAVGLEAPAAVRDYLGNLVQRALAAQLPQLPFGLGLQEVTVEPDGLAITATGHDVLLVS